MPNGISSAIDAINVTVVAIKKIKAMFFRSCDMPINKMLRTASMSAKRPTKKPRTWGSGPLNSNEIQAIMEERRNMAERR